MEAGEVQQLSNAFERVTVTTSSTPPRLTRDILSEFARQILKRGRFIDIHTFKFFYVEPHVTETLLQIFSGIEIFTMESGQGRLSDRSGKIKLYLNFAKDKRACKWLNMLVDIMVGRGEDGRHWLTELHLNSMEGINSVKHLANILCKLRGVRYLAFPSTLGFFTEDGGREMLKLVQINGESLRVLKHIGDLALVPSILAKNVAVINYASMRNANLSVEQDFFALYARGEQIPYEDWGTTDEKGVSMRIRLHRVNNIFRCIEGSFVRGTLTHLHITVTHSFEWTSMRNYLDCLGGLSALFPSLQQVKAKAVLLDTDPTLEDLESVDNYIPFSTSNLEACGMASLEWIQGNLSNLLFEFFFTFHLLVDYYEGNQKNLLKLAAEQTMHVLERKLPMEIRTEDTHGIDVSYRKQLSEKLHFEAIITFQLISYGPPRNNDEEEESAEQYRAEDGLLGNREKSNDEIDEVVFRNTDLNFL